MLFNACQGKEWRVTSDSFPWGKVHFATRLHLLFRTFAAVKF